MYDLHIVNLPLFDDVRKFMKFAFAIRFILFYM